MRLYEIMSKVEVMKKELEKLSLKKINLSGFTDERQSSGQDFLARLREMLKIVVSDFKRGDADEVLNSIANYNFLLKACNLDTDISKISHKRYVRGHVQRARTGPATAPRTPSLTTTDSATQTYMKITTCDARASPKRPKTRLGHLYGATEKGENHGPARASPPARDAIGHGSGTPPTH